MTENVYRLIERGSVTGPFLVTDDFGAAGRAAMDHTSKTGKYVQIYDRDGWRGTTKKVKRGKETVAVTIEWSRVTWVDRFAREILDPERSS